MGGIVRTVKKVVKKVAKVAKKALPIASQFLPPPFNTIASVASLALNSGAAGKDRSVSSDPQIAAAQRRQQALLNQQQAAVARERQSADAREAELSGRAASQRNAILARRRGRGGLAFSGPRTGLKSQLGG